MTKPLPNEQLRTLMLQRGISAEELAAKCGIDTKSVERWLSHGRVPHRQNRWTAAKLLDADETYLWPSILARGVRGRAGGRAELIELYPDRASVPRETWLRLLGEAQTNVDVLVNAGSFFTQVQPRIVEDLAERAREGVRARLCFGDPASTAVAVRDAEEGLAGTLAAQIQASLIQYRGLLEVDGVEIRLHGTTLYHSIFRYDDQLVVNPHVYGSPSSLNPALRLQKIDGGLLFDLYCSAFERIWDVSVPWLGVAPPKDQ
ncbi:helix-turn-helix domain-containing protein [Paractinoplanes durhamensis]|uniref:Transcriptional regulator n=1 Tax=Paractinoplanes durhamensis TaxID=113563 RepID=A0ABQ3Z6V6_9ACTN|nr:helix-turn-helix domain-containing protein [Actinoplanes durhamensis]GIE05568.1 transcriptional regulator [Actinoplanes durhamensis]